MNYTKENLHEMYNATSTDDGNGDIETYENWLERQLISRIETIKELKRVNGGGTERKALHIDGVISRFSNDVIDSVIHELNAYGHNYNHYDYGLPTYDEHMDNMRNIVKMKLNGL